jgi:hypothetical protein
MNVCMCVYSVFVSVMPTVYNVQSMVISETDNSRPE